MKRMMNVFGLFTLLVVMVTATVNVKASEGGTGSVSFEPVAKSKKAIVSIQKPMDENPVVRVRDAAGKLLHEKVFKDSDKVKRLYDFTFLGNGKYTMEVKLNGEWVTRSFSVDGHELHVENSENGTDKNSPVFYMKGDVLHVAYLNPRKAPVTVKLYDVSGDLIYQDRFDGDFGFQKRFDLSKLRSGSHMAVLSTTYNTYSESIRVR
jgi:hypothetical protein